MKKLNENIWTEAVCKKMIGPQSYAVASGNRSSHMLRMVVRSSLGVHHPLRILKDPDLFHVSNNPSTIALPADLAFSSTFTRSVVRPLVRFQDYKTLENLHVLSSSLYNCI